MIAPSTSDAIIFGDLLEEGENTVVVMVTGEGGVSTELIIITVYRYIPGQSHT